MYEFGDEALTNDSIDWVDFFISMVRICQNEHRFSHFIDFTIPHFIDGTSYSDDTENSGQF